MLYVPALIYLRAPTNGKIASRKVNTSGINKRNIFIKTVLFAFLKRSVVFLRFLNLALRLARFSLIRLRIMILCLTRLYVTIIRFERLRARLNRKKNRFKVKSFLGIENRR